jgi:hypothetical protein
VREQWTYYEVGKIFVFDPCGRLAETHSIGVEHRRDWQYQRNVSGYVEDVCNDN